MSTLLSYLKRFTVTKLDLIIFTIFLLWKLNLFFSSLFADPQEIVIRFTFFEVLLLLPVIHLFSRKWRIISIFILDLSISLLLLSNIIYYRYFHDLLSISLIKQFGQVSSLADSIWTLFEIKDIIYFADIPLLIIIYIIMSRQNWFSHSKRFINHVITFLIIVLLICIPLREKYKYVEGANITNARFANTWVADHLGIINYHVFDIYKYISNMILKEEVSTEKVTEIKQWYHDQNNGISKGDLFGKAKGQNIILIQAESLQSFVVDLTIDSQEITPNLNRLKKESVYFPNFFDQTDQGRTSDGEFTTLVSMHPSRFNGSIYFNFADNTFEGLPFILGEHGYSTLSAHGYDGGFWNRAFMHRNLGFQKSLFASNLNPGENLGWGLSDMDFLNQMGDTLPNLKQPFFSFLITLTNHHPFELPPEHRELQLGDLEGSLMGNYLHSAHYFDKALGTFIESLKEKGLYDSSLFAIYGDHDAGLPLEELERIGLTQQFDRQFDKVPFLIHSTALANQQGVVDEQASGHLDISPTLLYLLGVSQDDKYFLGQPLFDQNSENHYVPFRDGSFAKGDYIFLNTTGSFKKENVWNFKTEQQENGLSKVDFENANYRLTTSDLFLEGDLIPKVRK
ncbi:LTA synthase family protein [Bacillus sp. DX4.1]|uniref:LTA synthase family protein n=1 Tax=Bacillus sp. DX4.1 TaxID=3055867 RepID=UPI0025A05076|nr:LTA synthase family protein [Bacillus sp. DX4.1]MDM5190547.1 LTA synthase family protein [Bacillus sp. DX4.1]